MAPGSLGWALPVGRVFGIPVALHWSWLAILAGRILQDLVRGTPTDALISLAIWTLCWLSVLGHELAHALTARRFGQQALAIELYLWGGAAFSSGWSMPRQDMMIALAGPASNATFALGAWSLASVVPHATAHQILMWVAWFNGVVALFNLLPAFPLDGGHALRSALRLTVGSPRADAIACTVGIWTSVAGLVVAFWRQDMFLAVIFFVTFEACRVSRLAHAPMASLSPPRRLRVQAPSPAGWLDRVRGWFRRDAEPTVPKLRVIKGGRFEDPPDSRSRAS